jgi:D-glycero-D-manno-heptose 1,7-bisphosphate phosphatase
MIQLIIFDLDGTLAQSQTERLLPGVNNFFQLIFQGECPLRPKIAIATNQGGVGLRYWMERDHFGKPSPYPTADQIEERLSHLSAQLGFDSQVPVYISFRYQNKQGKWSPVPPEKEHDPRWLSDWRKPSPGMLLQAMQDANVTPADTVYVGDRDEDQAAAHAAGCFFWQASEFFTQDWSGCTALEKMLEKALAGDRDKTETNHQE